VYLLYLLLFKPAFSTSTTGVVYDTGVGEQNGGAGPHGEPHGEHNGEHIFVILVAHGEHDEREGPASTGSGVT
jgi:hypothetical protein